MDKETFMRQCEVSGMPLDKIELANAAWDAATAAEREACAKLSESLPFAGNTSEAGEWRGCGSAIAESIRART